MSQRIKKRGKNMNIKNYFLLAIIFLTINKAFAYDYDAFKLIYDFYGSTYKDGTIYIYGDSGQVLHSEDKGKNWNVKQLFRNDSASIKKLITSNNGFIGITKNGFLFKTNNHFEQLEVFEKIDKIGDFDISENQEIYIAHSLNKKITKLSLNFQIKEEFEIKDTVNIKYILFVDENLFITTYSNRVYKYNIQNKNLEQIILEDNIEIPSQLLKYKNTAAIVKGGSFYEYSETNMNFRKIYGIDGGNKFQTNGSTIYRIDKIDVLEDYVAYAKLYKYENQKLSGISLNGVERYVLSNLQINSLNVFENELIVATGPNKTLYISEDNGKTLNLVSRIDKSIEFMITKWLDENRGYFVGKSAQIFHTNNGGLTFLPQLFTDRLIYFAGDTYTSTAGFTIDTNGIGVLLILAFQDKIKDTTKMFNCLVTQNFGETFEPIWVDGIRNRTSVLGKTNSSSDVKLNKLDDKYYFQISRSTSSSNLRHSASLFEFDLNNKQCVYRFLDSTNLTGIFFQKYKFYSLLMEARYPSKENWTLYDSAKFYIGINKKLNDEFEQKIELPFDNPNLIIGCSGNSPKDNEIFIYVGYYTKVQPDDSVFNRRCTIHRFNLDKYTITKVWDDTIRYVKDKINEQVPKVILMDKYYTYLYDKDYTIKRCRVEDLGLLKWDLYDNFIETSTITPYKNYSRYTEFVFNDHAFFNNNRKFTKTGTFNLVSELEQVERKQTKLHFFNPYPQPAKSQIKIKIYTNNLECFDKKGFEAFNTNGEKISSSNDFEILQVGMNEAEIIWDCNSINSGVYFIKLNCENKYDVIKVIKE